MFSFYSYNKSQFEHIGTMFIGLNKETYDGTKKHTTTKHIRAGVCGLGVYSWSPFCIVNLFRQQDFQISRFVLTESLTRLTLSERVVAYKVARSMLKQTCLPFTYRCNTFKYKYKYTMARSMLLKKICLFCTWPLSILHSNTNAYTTWQKVFKMSTFAVIHSNTHTNAKWGELCLNKRVMSTLYLSSQYLYIIGSFCLSVCHEKWSLCPMVSNQAL